jgi:lantibiotic biosynthesis protein
VLVSPAKNSPLEDNQAQLTAVRLIEEALEAAVGKSASAGLFEGITGVAWTLAHVDGSLLDLSEVDPGQAVDSALLNLLTTSPWTAEYDLIGGLVGIGV